LTGGGGACHTRRAAGGEGAVIFPIPKGPFFNAYIAAIPLGLLMSSGIAAAADATMATMMAARHFRITPPLDSTQEQNNIARLYHRRGGLWGVIHHTTDKTPVCPPACGPRGPCYALGERPTVHHRPAWVAFVQWGALELCR
jgi:hypothetical protein